MTRTITTSETLNAFRIPAERFWELSRATGDDGYDTMDTARAAGWSAVSGWGQDGWDFLEWPYYVGYVRNRGGAFELGTCCEGDVDVWSFPTLELRTEAMDFLAFSDWERKGESWAVREADGSVPARLCGPFSWERCNAARDAAASA